MNTEKEDFHASGEMGSMDVEQLRSLVRERKEEIERLSRKIRELELEKNKSENNTRAGQGKRSEPVPLFPPAEGILSEGTPAEGDSDKTRQAGSRVLYDPLTGVLLVDNNSGDLAAARDSLLRHGITPDAAENANQAMAMIQAKKYDLIFMEPGIPVMNGFEVARFIRSLEGDYYGGVPIIALSADESARELYSEAGMNDFIAKPMGAAELNGVLLRWLPREKLRGVDTAEEQPKADKFEFNALLAELTQVEDLSIISGISRADGDKTLYLNTLRRLCQTLEQESDDIRALQLDRDWRQYAERMRSLKDIFADVGNQFLSDWASSLEKAAARMAPGDIKQCQMQTLSFCSAVKKFQANLLETRLMQQARHEGEKEPISREALIKKLKTLDGACLDCNTDTAGKIADELRRVTFREDVDARLAVICDLIASFDYDEVIAQNENLLFETLSEQENR